MRFLDSATDPKGIRALKFFLIATLMVGAVASFAARPLPVVVAPWLIAPAWTLSYSLMAVAAWLAWKQTGLKSVAMGLYAAQLALNLLWRIWPVQRLGLIMDLVLLATLILFARRSPLAALALLPCLAWSLPIA